MRVVLCGERRLVVEAIEASLVRRGHDVAWSTNDPASAFAAVRSLDPDVCVLHLPFGRDGAFAVARSIAASARCRVLVLSADARATTVRAALAAGACGFLATSQRLEDLLAALGALEAGATSVPVTFAPPWTVTSEPPDRADADTLRYLTPREREALARIAEGRSTKEIARSMHVAYSTARTHVQNVLTKLGVRSQLQAAAFAARSGVPTCPTDLYPAPLDTLARRGRSGT